MNSKPLVLEGVSLEFNKKRILDDINLTVNKGEFFSIFGASGSGKTSLLKLMSGINKATKGNIKVFGVEQTGSKMEHKIITVWQSRALFPHLTVRKNIEFGLKYLDIPKKEKETRFEAIVELMKIGYLLDRSPKKLSGGEQQKIALARAIIVQPDILLLDEPFNGIDEIFKEELRNELKELFDIFGATYILVSHDIKDILAFSDKIAIIENHKIRQVGTPKEIFEKPKSSFIAKAFGGYNILKAKVEEVKGKGIEVSSVLGSHLSNAYEDFEGEEQVNYLVSPNDVFLDGNHETSTEATIRRIDHKGLLFDILFELKDGSFFKASNYKTETTDKNYLTIKNLVPISWDIKNTLIIKK